MSDLRRTQPSHAHGGRSRQGRLITVLRVPAGVPDGSAGKESACDAGEPTSIPGLGRSAGEGIGYPLQNSWASLAAQLVKNPPATREAWVRLSLSQRGPDSFLYQRELGRT